MAAPFEVRLRRTKNGGDFKPEIEPSAKRLDPILGQVLTDLKNYLSSVNLTQTEEFNKTVATFS